MKIFILFLSVFGVFVAYCNGEVRIAGGQNTEISQYPFAAALLTNLDGEAFIQRCGGTILTTTAILSVASCFHTGEQIHEPRNWRARVGSSRSASGGTIFFIRAINMHPDYQPTTRASDVAVVRTTFNMVFQSGVVEAARIAGRAYTFTPNQVVTAIGWGDGAESEEPTTQLRHVDIWVVDQALCSERYQDTDITVNENHVCAGWIDVGVRGQCPGDYGSPLLDADSTVVGVFSQSEGCAHLLHPGLNTRVAPFVNWIVASATA